MKGEMDERGLEAARGLARWFLGHPSWADDLLSAYFNPEVAEELLRREKDSA